jgi:hypothetical protein
LQGKQPGSFRNLAYCLQARRPAQKCAKKCTESLSFLNQILIFIIYDLRNKVRINGCASPGLSPWKRSERLLGKMHVSQNKILLVNSSARQTLLTDTSGGRVNYRTRLIAGVRTPRINPEKDYPEKDESRKIG